MHAPARGLVAAVAAVVLGGCGDGEPSSGAAAALPADLAIAEQLYLGTARTPAGFLADAPPPSFAQVTTYHVKSRQLDPAAATLHELCTDDWTEALAWSETLAELAPSYLDLVGNTATASYYELDRVPRADPDRYVRMRVFRCAYLDRTGVDLAAAATFAGTFNRRPLDAAGLGELSEYLWQFTPFNNIDHAVLSSEPRAVALGLAHVITLASLERALEDEACDRVVLREWTHSLDLTTGALDAATAALRQFAVRREGGVAVAC